ARSVPRVLNLYGPTEATVWASSAAVRPGDDRVTIGRPLGNSRLYVLDAAGRPCPVGVPGELYLGGQGVARGYHAREDLTAQRFPSDPERGRLFRTGDLGRWLADGTVEFLGRDDRQVKLRGFRIELGEIEAQLRRHPGVTDAVVEVRGPDDDRRLIAWVVGLDAVHPNDLRAHLRAHLPDYMVPAQFVALDRVPLNPNGKLDRAALPDPATPQGAHRVYVAPGSPLEQSLAEVWAEVLGVGRVGRDDDFFELGGHSLLAVQIVARIRASVGIGLSLRDFMQTPTIAACAARIRPNDAQRSA
ncbi:MAG: AMP-binding protein, partial [Myxococcota bacterium]